MVVARFALVAVVALLACAALCSADGLPEKLQLSKFLEGDWTYQKTVFTPRATTAAAEEEDVVLVGRFAFTKVSDYAVDGASHENSSVGVFLNARKIRVEMESDSTATFSVADAAAEEDDASFAKWFELDVAKASNMYVSKHGSTLFRVVSNDQFLVDTVAADGTVTSIVAFRDVPAPQKGFWQKYSMPIMMLVFFAVNIYSKMGAKSRQPRAQRKAAANAAAAGAAASASSAEKND